MKHIRSLIMDKSLNQPYSRALATFAVSLGLMSVTACVEAAVVTPLPGRDLVTCSDTAVRLPAELTVNAGSQELIALPGPVTRVAIGEPLTADIAIIDQHTLLLQARKAGETTLLVWTRCSKEPSRLLIHVPAEASAIQKLVQVAATEKEAAVLPSQVQVDIRFVELSRTRLIDLGVRLAAGNGKNTAFGSNSVGLSSSTASQVVPNTFSLSSITNPSAFNIFWGATGGKLTSAINLLEQNGYAYTLSQPTLVALSGQSASFLAGGEVPVPVPQGGLSNAITILYKEFGVRLSVTPTILSNNQIILKVAPEVSELDYTNAITISGSAVPALSIRRSDTTISLADGESFVISGLVSRNLRDSVSKLPGLADIPILGAFFRSKTFKSEDKELLMVVTPHLVRPLAADAKLPALPGDNLRNFRPSAGEYFIKSQVWPYPDAPIGFSR